jgi:hypothetical protein
VITAWSPSGARRSRSTAALWRVLGLGLFLFGLLYTHAVSPEATVSHLAVEGVHSELVAVADAEPAGHSGGHERHHHAGEDCTLGQPPQSPDIAVPCLSPLPSVSDSIVPLPRPLWVRHAPADGMAPPTHAAASAVLRI